MAEGKLHLTLIRPTTLVADMLAITEDELTDEPAMSRPSWIDTVNEVKVQYPERTS